MPDTGNDARRRPVAAASTLPQDLRSVLLRLFVFVQWVLLLGVLVAPLGRSDPSGEVAPESLGYFSLLGYLIGSPVEELASRPDVTEDNLGAGRGMVIVGLVLLGLGVAVAALSSLRLYLVDSKGPRVAIRLGQVGLIAGTAITFAGLVWLPNGSAVSTPAVGLMVPLVAAGWSMLALDGARQLIMGGESIAKMRSFGNVNVPDARLW